MADDLHTNAEPMAERELAQLIESVRSMVAEQFQIAERLDRKARYQAGTAGAFFAVVQAVALNALTGGELSNGWIAILAIFALPAALLTLGAFLSASDAWRTQQEKDLPIPDLRSMVEDISRGEPHAERELAHHYLNLAEKRREGNAERLVGVKRAANAAIMSLVLTGLELVLVFVALSSTHG